jgi:hypothetical protein
MTKLQLYNNALLHLGELNLSSLTENREPRRVLDQIYDSGFINTLLEEGFWKFASKSVKMDYDHSVTPAFGFSRAFEKPSDFVTMCKICTDEYYNFPLLRYSDEGNYIFSDLDEIYIQYVSNLFGSDLSTWPDSFSRYAELYLAVQACERITHSSERFKTVFALMKKAKFEAKNKDAMKNPTKFLPSGTFVTSRGGRGGNGGRSDRGGRGGLIG